MTVFELSSPLARSRRTFSFLKLDALWRSRRTLATLDEAALSDIGISREDAEAEAGKAIWDVPQHWRG